MTTIKTIINGRRLELDVPADWPDGTEIEIHPVEQQSNGAAMAPEEIARTLAAMDQVIPFDMPEAELAAWETERQTAREREKAQFAGHAQKLRRMWE